MFKDGAEAKIGYPTEGYSGEVAGRSFHNGKRTRTAATIRTALLPELISCARRCRACLPSTEDRMVSAAGRFVQRLRQAAAASSNVTMREARVKQLLNGATLNTPELQVSASL